jgi:two-component system cell cycle response regulator CpdR
VIVYLLNILLVDDDKDTLRIIQKYFESKGARVSTYSESLIALQDFMKNSNGNNQYDLVLSDIKMPEMDGIELASNIRRMNKNIPIILMTASSMECINHSIINFLNIEDIIAKPVKLKGLLEKVNTINQNNIVRQQQ